MNQRQEIIDYIHEKYGAEIEYLWMRYPSYGIFRHADNQKWYALMMDVPRSKLGQPSDEIVDILNVKLDDPLLRDFLVQREGFLPGYHISRGNWISILLDGAVELSEIYSLIDTSYKVTASAQTRKAIRPPREWIIPSNPTYYDSVHAFDHPDEIDWKQGIGIKVGDVVYMYVGAPVSAILYKCIVTKTDIPWEYTQDKLSIFSLMKIKLLKRYAPEQFTFDRLGTEYDIHAVRGPRGIPRKLSEALNPDTGKD